VTKTAVTYQSGKIHDVVVKPLTKFLDDRGWLSELFRHDELDGLMVPVMSYLSMTKPGVARGPHEHREQTDYFCFLGPSNFKIYLWDARTDSPTFAVSQCFYAGQDSPKMLIVPPGVVHAYKNVGIENGLVFNAPDKLYAGEGKRSPVDEIRHEEAEGSSFFLD
jgi:dTDP-4-dehydrorhamnose 3,5-epimerase